MEEEWKSIQEFPTYMISNFGRLYNTKTNKIIQPAGYHLERVTVC